MPIDGPAASELAGLGHDPAGATLEPLTHNRANSVTGGIWRVRGRDVSYVLKVLRGDRPDESGRWPTSDDPVHWNYWRREALVYETGLPEAFAGSGLRAPECHAAVVRGPHEVALWLEDAQPTEEWSVERVARTALEPGARRGRSSPDGRSRTSRGSVGAGCARTSRRSRCGRSSLDDEHPVWRLTPCAPPSRRRSGPAPPPLGRAGAPARARRVAPADPLPPRLLAGEPRPARRRDRGCRLGLRGPRRARRGRVEPRPGHGRRPLPALFGAAGARRRRLRRLPRRAP